MYATERREGAGVEGKASSRAKCWWEGANQLEEVAFSLGSLNYFVLHAKRHSPGSPHTVPSPEPPNHGGALPEIKEQRNPTIFQLSIGGL